MGNEIDWEAAREDATEVYEGYGDTHRDFKKNRLARAYLAALELLKRAHETIGDGDAGLREEIRQTLQTRDANP